VVDVWVGKIWGARVWRVIVVAVGITNEERKGKAKHVGIAWKGRRYDWVLIWMGISIRVRRGEKGRVVYLAVCETVMHMALPDVEILAEWAASASAWTGRSGTVGTVCRARVGLCVGTL